MTKYRDPIANAYVEMLTESTNPDSLRGYASKMHKEITDHIRDEMRKSSPAPGAKSSPDFRFNDKLKDGSRSLKTYQSLGPNHKKFLDNMSKYGVTYKITDVVDHPLFPTGGAYRIHVPAPTPEMEAEYKGKEDFPKIEK